MTEEGMQRLLATPRYASVTKSPIPVLVNRNGGTASAKGEALCDELEKAFAAEGLTIDLQLIDGDAMAKAVAKVADRPIIAVGGGDGTIGCAAGALIGAKSKAKLAVLPLGTRNHLALELGCKDIATVAKAIAAGTTQRIDLGTVNGRAFINNASIGFYPEMVRQRDAQRERGLPKWLANLPAAWVVLKRARHHRLHLTMEGHKQPVRTPMLFVGNNRYELAPTRLGKRKSLEDGLLSVYAVERRSPLRLAGFAARTLIGRADFERDFAAVGEVAKLKVEAHAGTVDIAIDGEVMRLKSPLVFTALPQALEVIVPAPLEKA
jgi:diacylglycerol kinase family enzyme